MNRRNFFRTMIGGVAASAAVRTWPFRVFSFPSEIKPAYFVPEFPQGTWGALDRAEYPGRLCTPLSKNVEAVELESFADQIPCLIRNDAAFHKFFTRNSEISVGRSSFRIPFSWKMNEDQLAATAKKYAEGVDVQAAIDAL